MTFDEFLAVWLGVCIALVVAVKLVSAALVWLARQALGANRRKP